MKKNRRTLKLLTIIVIFLLCNINISSIAHEGHCDCCTCHEGSKLPKEIKDGTVLTIQDCISIGLKNSPVIKRQKYALDIAKSNVGVAKSVYFPTISAGAGYGQVNNSNSKYLESLYRELPRVGVSLHQMIWDFGRSHAAIKMEEFYKIGAEYEFMDSVCTTVFDIKMKYYDVLRAQSILDIKKFDYDINSRLIDDIKSMITTNKADKVDLINAQTQQLKIKNEIIEAEDDLKNAKENLNNAIYFLNAPNYKISETQTYNNEYKKVANPFKYVSYTTAPKTLKIETSKSEILNIHPNFTYEEAVELAYKNSPDLKVLEATKDAMKQSLLVIKRSYYPELSADAGYNRINTNHYNNNDMTIGVNLTADLNAMQLKHSLKGAYAQVDLAQTEIDKYRDDLYFKVRKALNTANKAKEQIPVSKQQLSTASENFDLTLSRYKENKMNQLELLYARTAYTNSMQDYVEAVYRYNVALIDLEISMHYHLIDLHDRTEHAIKYHDEDIIENFNNIMDCDRHDHK